MSSRKCDIFYLINLYVYIYKDIVSGDESSTKVQLETMIKENGGNFLQTSHGVKYVIAGLRSK